MAYVTFLNARTDTCKFSEGFQFSAEISRIKQMVKGVSVVCDQGIAFSWKDLNYEIFCADHCQIVANV